MSREIDVVLLSTDDCRVELDKYYMEYDLAEEGKEMDIRNRNTLEKEGSGIWWIYNEIDINKRYDKLCYLLGYFENECYPKWSRDKRIEELNNCKGFIKIDEKLSQLDYKRLKDFIRINCGIMDGIKDRRNRFPNGLEIPSIELSVVKDVDVRKLWIQDYIKDKDIKTIIVWLNALDWDVDTLYHYNEIMDFNESRHNLIHKGIN